MGKRKIIGIPGWKIGDNSFGVTSDYLEFASVYGDARIIMPWEEVVPVDLLILPGGADIQADRYGQTPSYKNTNPDLFKQYFYDNKLSKYIDSNISVFGICLGAQQLNVYFGGSLTQNLLFHPQSPDRWMGAHYVFKVGESPKSKFEVNSHHHQGIVLEKENLATCLAPLTISKDESNDGSGYIHIVESFKHTSLKVAGVQWHPEQFYDNHSDELIKELLS